MAEREKASSVHAHAGQQGNGKIHALIPVQATPTADILGRVLYIK